jgi:hypothetical protein
MGTTACGFTERKWAATTEASVANRPGPTPPMEALAATARTNKVRGTSVPRIGCNSQTTTMAPATNASAIG